MLFPNGYPGVSTISKCSNSSTKLIYGVNSHLPYEGALPLQNPMPFLVILLRHVQVCMCIRYGGTETETQKETQRQREAERGSDLFSSVAWDLRG